MTRKQNASKRPLSREMILSACGHEVEDLARSCTRIESALGKAIRGSRPASENLVIELQDLDRVRQILNNLALVLTGLASPGVDLDVLITQIRLSDLRERISGHANNDIAVSSRAPHRAISTWVSRLVLMILLT